MGRYSNFNTDGQTKCPACGGYYPSGWNQHGCRQELEELYNSSPDSQQEGS